MNHNRDTTPEWLEGDTKLFSGIKDIFLKNVPTQMERLKDALISKDIPTITLLSHSIKGSAAMIGATSLRELAGRLEQASLEGDLDKVRVCYEGLEIEFQKAISMLQSS